MPLEDIKEVLTDLGVTKDSVPRISFHKNYSGYEIILLATEIEKVGHLYYKYAQKLATSKEVADIFKIMAADELEHIKLLHKKIKPLFLDADDYFWENEETVAQYLSRDTQSSVFKDLEELKAITDEMKTQEEAIDLCIEGEKRAVAFYKTVLDQTIGNQGKKAIERILEEEKKHVEKLVNLKKELTS